MFTRRRDQGLTSEQTEGKEAALSQSPGSSQPTAEARPRYEVHSGTRFEMLTGRARLEGQPQTDTHPPDGTMPSDLPTVVPRSPNVSRIPRPRGQVFVNPPDHDTDASGSGFSTNPTETRGAVPVRNRRSSNGSRTMPDVQPCLAASFSIMTIDNTPRENYGPAESFLAAANYGDQISSLPSTHKARQAGPRQTRRKLVPPQTGPPKPIVLRDYNQAPPVGSQFSKFLPSEQPVIQAGKAQPRRLHWARSMQNLWSRERRHESGEAGLQTASKGLKSWSSIPKLAQPLTSKPAKLTKARPAKALPKPSAPVLVTPMAQQSVQPAMPTLALSAVNVLAETLPRPQELVQPSTSTPAQSPIFVLGETVPSPAVPAPTANRPLVNAVVSPMTIALPQDGQGDSTPQSWAELTLCVNRLGKRLVHENDPEQRKKLYADFVRLMSLRADVLSREDLCAEQESLLAVMRAESSGRRILASLRAHTIYQEDGTLRNMTVPTDQIVKEW